MGTPLGPKYIPYTYMDPWGRLMDLMFCRNCGQRRAGGLDMAAAFDAVRDAIQEAQGKGILPLK